MTAATKIVSLAVTSEAGILSCDGISCPARRKEDEAHQVNETDTMQAADSGQTYQVNEMAEWQHRLKMNAYECCAVIRCSV